LNPYHPQGMHLGILAKTFARPTWAETLDAVVACGLDCVQFNFASLGLPTLPDKIDPEVVSVAAGELKRRNIAVAAVSGTFNMIDPDPAQRREGLRRLDGVAASCAALGASMVTLCTGTRDPDDMWRAHPQNDSAAAWEDLRTSMREAVKIADKYNIFLGVEPETSNVVNSAQKARRLLDEMGSPRLKIIMDAANLFGPGQGARMTEILDEAFALLGRDIALAHAKDFRDGTEFTHVAAGRGMLDWRRLLRLFRAAGFDGPLILHGLREDEVKTSVAFLRQELKNSERPSPVPVPGMFSHDGIDFHYQVAGVGIPFFFQHGLGADTTQPFGLFRPPGGIRLIGFDCRAHGQTHPVGPSEKISLAAFADDLLALMDYLKVEKAVVGGISMGAAVALNFALRYPERTLGLVLHRPAWLDAPRRDNVVIFNTIAGLLRQHGAEKGLEVFKQSEIYQRALARSNASAASLASQFLHPRAQEAVVRLEKIPLDSPCADRRKWRTLAVPTLVLANDHDAIHPLEYGVTLSREIPGAEFKELTPKSISADLHREETQHFLEDFLLRHF
jgi:sugar phosphate isomerase/epimerase/pimeloyl-ACP methyl ester carboxylesterase